MGKKNSSLQRHYQESVSVTPQHEEIVKFIHEGWNVVHREYEDSQRHTPDSSSKAKPKIIYYSEQPSAKVEEFRMKGAFDLENWWGQRMYRNLTQSS